MRINRHWETHLYTFAVAYSQRLRITPENLAGMRAKAIRHGHPEWQCAAVEANPSQFIIVGEL